MKLHCYALHEHAPELVAAAVQRRWMDDFPDRHPYRCLPLSIANAHGWEILCPAPIEIEWNGGTSVKDLSVRALTPLPGDRPVDHLAKSNFSRGIITFHVDYIFRTEPGWNLMATGPLNRPKDNAYALSGIIEAEWLPYPFTMNWQILRPGRLRFEKDEPICFIFPVRTEPVLECQPEIRLLSEAPEISRQHTAFVAARNEFMQRFHAGDPDAIRQAWQRYYFVGRHPDGTHVQEHVSKIRMKDPIDLRPPRPPVSEASVDSAVALDAFNLDKRWEAGSFLNKMSTHESAANRAGRCRIDRDGRLAERSRSRIIRSQSDARGCDFLVVEALLTKEQCQELCETFADLRDHTFRSDQIDPYWNDRFIWYADVASRRPDVAQSMLGAHAKALRLIQEFYRLNVPIYADLLQIVQWRSGMLMRPHADNAKVDGSLHDMAYRDFAGIFYLNDDYTGGELYLTALDVVIKPKQGMFVAMTAGFHHEHAVLRVETGARLTMPLFFTFDFKKADRLLLEPLHA